MMKPDIADYLSRVLKNDVARRGLGRAIAGVVVAAVAEALWPSPLKS